MQDVTAFILAGGRSSRMGEEKAFLEINGRGLIDHVIIACHGVAEDMFIVGPKDKFGAYGRIVNDIYPDSGPLGGIHAALERSRTELSLMLAVDTPLISTEFLNFLTSIARESKATVIVPKANGGFQPLCAVYRKPFAAIAEKALRTKQLKIDPLFPADSTRIVTEQEIRDAGFDPAILANLNTKEEYERAATNAQFKRHGARAE